MGRQELDDLVKIGKLKAEAASRKEFDGMLASARRGLADAQNQSIETDSQLDLAYGAAHPGSCPRAWGALRLRHVHAPPRTGPCVQMQLSNSQA
jgi:hypothetical protein